MFSPLNEELLRLIEDWIDVSTPDDMQILSQIFKESRPSFVFEQRAFITRFLDKADQHGKEVFDNALNSLYVSMITGVKQGTPGEPFPQDIMIRDESVKALKEIPRFIPAYRLYKMLKEHAEDCVAQSLNEREAFDDE